MTGVGDNLGNRWRNFGIHRSGNDEVPVHQSNPAGSTDQNTKGNSSIPAKRWSLGALKKRAKNFADAAKEKVKKVAETEIRKNIQKELKKRIKDHSLTKISAGFLAGTVASRIINPPFAILFGMGLTFCAHRVQKTLEARENLEELNDSSSIDNILSAVKKLLKDKKDEKEKEKLLKEISGCEVTSGSDSESESGSVSGSDSESESGSVSGSVSGSENKKAKSVYNSLKTMTGWNSIFDILDENHIGNKAINFVSEKIVNKFMSKWGSNSDA